VQGIVLGVFFFDCYRLKEILKKLMMSVNNYTLQNNQQGLLSKIKKG
jgi:hypothetical protein